MRGESLLATRTAGLTKNIGAAQPPDFRDAPVLPVLDSLRATGARVYAEHPGDVCRPAEACDQVCVWVKDRSHGGITHPVSSAVNTSRVTRSV